MRTLIPALSTAASVLLSVSSASAQIGGPYNLTWNTIDGGGGTSAGGPYSLSGTIGQPDAGRHTGGIYECQGGFWNGGASGTCYANCDNSTIAPILNVNDFVCFNNRYAAGNPYANCDASTIAPVLNVNDFVCFNNKYAAGCP